MVIDNMTTTITAYQICDAVSKLCFLCAILLLLYGIYYTFMRK